MKQRPYFVTLTLPTATAASSNIRSCGKPCSLAILRRLLFPLHHSSTSSVVTEGGANEPLIFASCTAFRIFWLACASKAAHFGPQDTAMAWWISNGRVLKVDLYRFDRFTVEGSRDRRIKGRKIDANGFAAGGKYIWLRWREVKA